MQNCSFNLFHIPDLILYLLKTLKRVWYSDFHRGYRKTFKKIGITEDLFSLGFTSVMSLIPLEENQLMEVGVQNTLWKDAGHRSSLSGRCYEQVLDILIIFTANINPLKINERNVRKRCDIYLKLTIKAPERRHWRRSNTFIVNFDYVLPHFSLVLLLLTLNW